MNEPMKRLIFLIICVLLSAGISAAQSYDELFAGEEALWISDVPYWSMNYAGRVTGGPFSGDFLKEALLHVPAEKPYRGPDSYTDGDYVYYCDTEGSFDWFRGKETIEYRGEPIYECYFHGGIIK